eukprot:511804-Hanusia_phi.AAC.2
MEMETMTEMEVRAQSARPADSDSPGGNDSPAPSVARLTVYSDPRGSLLTPSSLCHVPERYRTVTVLR